MSLAILPSDILGHILSSVHSSFLIVALWKCGDSLLSRKLAQGVEFVNLKDTRFDSISRYPKLLSELRSLRYLSINRGRFPLTSSPIELSLNLQELQGDKLTTLKLQSFDCGEGLFLYSGPLSDSTHPQPVVTRYPLGYSRYFDIGRHFPSLETLKIDPRDIRFSLVDFEDFPGLPSTLTKLIIPEMRLKSYDTPACAMLPRNLLTWKSQISWPPSKIDWLPHQSSSPCPIYPKFWEDPPQALHTISGIYDSTILGITDMGRLPKTLTFCDFLAFNSSFPETAATLPPLISRISRRPIDLAGVSPMQEDYLSWNMPHSLTALDLRNSEHDGLIPPKLIPTLPDTIATLSIETGLFGGFGDGMLKKAFEDWSSKTSPSESSSFWPASLTRLIITGMIETDIVDYLPQNLKRLELDWEENQFDPSPLPQGLYSLILNIGLPTMLLNRYPKSLTSLSIGRNMNDISSMLLLEGFTPPPSLTYLGLEVPINGSSKSILNSLVLPPGLKTLSVLTWRPEWFSLLPAALTELVVHHLELVGDDTTTLEQAECWRNLPTSLTSLYAAGRIVAGESGRRRGPKKARICTSDAYFSALIHLRDLNVRRLGRFEQNILETLPPSIRLLSIVLETATQDSVKHLNPMWQKVDIKCGTEEGAQILEQYLPLNAIYESRSSGPIVSKRVAETAILRHGEAYASKWAAWHIQTHGEGKI